MVIMASSTSSAFTCTFPSQRTFLSSARFSKAHRHHRLLSLRASSDDSDCNVEECAPEKEVGKVSLEWLAGEKTKVAGTYPPRKIWSGYVEKDTAGQTNIYSVEPAVYVAESGISSGSAGSSADGSENTIAISAGVGLISVAAASLILVLVGKNSPPPVQTAVDYNGPSLSYYINKFKPQEIVQASAPPPTEEVQIESPVSEIQPEAEIPSASDSSNAS